MQTNDNTNPRFIADTMLGKLSRWLSLLGYNIVYAGIIDDDDLARIARAQHRIILSRDTRLAQNHPGAQVFLIQSTDLWEQLHEVIAHYRIDFPTTAFSRCSHCNVPIERVKKEDVEDSLPPLVQQTQTVIYQCPECKKLYWEASHVAHIKHLLREHLGIKL